MSNEARVKAEAQDSEVAGTDVAARADVVVDAAEAGAAAEDAAEDGAEDAAAVEDDAEDAAAEEAPTSEFESVKNRLAEIADAVSDESLSLDEALDLYEEAVALGLRASDLLEADVVPPEPEAEPDADVEGAAGAAGDAPTAGEGAAAAEGDASSGQA